MFSFMYCSRVLLNLARSRSLLSSSVLKAQITPLEMSLVRLEFLFPLFQSNLRPLLFTDTRHHGEAALEPPVRIENRLEGHDGRDAFAIFGNPGDLIGIPYARAPSAGYTQQGRPVFPPHILGDRGTNQFLLRVSQHLAKTLIHVGEHFLLVRSHQPIVHGFHETAVTLPALVEFLQDLLGFGGVSHHPFDGDRAFALITDHDPSVVHVANRSVTPPDSILHLAFLLLRHQRGLGNPPHPLPILRQNHFNHRGPGRKLHIPVFPVVEQPDLVPKDVPRRTDVPEGRSGAPRRGSGRGNICIRRVSCPASARIRCGNRWNSPPSRFFRQLELSTQLCLSWNLRPCLAAKIQGGAGAELRGLCTSQNSACANARAPCQYTRELCASRARSARWAQPSAPASLPSQAAAPSPISAPRNTSPICAGAWKHSSWGARIMPPFASWIAPLRTVSCSSIS